MHPTEETVTDDHADMQDDHHMLRMDEFIPATPEVTPFPFDELSGSCKRKLTIEFGAARLKRNLVESMTPGRVLTLENSTDDDVILQTEDGEPIAVGQLVVSDDRVAIRIKRRLDQKRNAI